MTVPSSAPCGVRTRVTAAAQSAPRARNPCGRPGSGWCSHACPQLLLLPDNKSARGDLCGHGGAAVWLVKDGHPRASWVLYGC